MIADNSVLIFGFVLLGLGLIVQYVHGKNKDFKRYEQYIDKLVVERLTTFGKNFLDVSLPIPAGKVVFEIRYSLNSGKVDHLVRFQLNRNPSEFINRWFIGSWAIWLWKNHTHASRVDKVTRTTLIPIWDIEVADYRIFIHSP